MPTAGNPGIPTSTDPRPSVTAWRSGIILAALLLVAAGLRFYRLGDWTLDGDEIYTLRDSLKPSFGNPRPLLFLLNFYLVRPLAGLDEFGLRMVAALAGALSVAAIYYIGRRLTGERAALFSALLLTFSPLMVYHSQYARYWSLVILLCTLYPYALYLGVRERSGRWLALGIVTAVLAVLAHPVALFPAGGLALVVLLNLRWETVATLWKQPAFRVFALVAGVLLVVAVLRSLDMLQGWVSSHDNKTRIPDHLRDAPRALGFRQLAILLALVEGLTLPVTLSGIAGLLLLRQGRDRSVAALLACVLLAPIATVLLLSVRTPVSVTYMLAAAPVIFLGAGVFLDRMASIDLGARPRWLVPVTVTAAIIAAGLPSLVSQYRDGRRFDFRGAAHWLDGQVRPGDLVFSLQSRILSYYLERARAVPLAPDTTALARSTDLLRRSGKGEALWIVVPAPSHAFRTNLRRGGLIGWIFDHCQLRNSLGVGRMDFRQQYLHIYRCPPTDAGRAVSGASQTSSEAQEGSAGSAAARGVSPFRASTSP
jgi:hypothetical protein